MKLDLCEACGSEKRDCDCILPPWKMESYVSSDEMARLKDMPTNANDLIDALVICLDMLVRSADLPADERAYVLAFAKKLTAHAIAFNHPPQEPTR